MPLVDIRNLSKVYRTGAEEVHALGGVSLRVEAGEFVAIVGQSGSGKSTLMNMLGCLDLPDSGEYLLDGEDVSHIPETALARIRNRRIGFIFQGFNLIPSLNALENVELPLIYRGIPARQRRELARSALEQVGIGHRIRHRPGQLSGGQAGWVDVRRLPAPSPHVHPSCLPMSPPGTSILLRAQKSWESCGRCTPTGGRSS